MPKVATVGDIALFLSRVFPPRFMYLLARVHGRLVYRLDKRRREIVSANLAPFADDAAHLARLTRRFFELRQVRVLMVLRALDMSPSERHSLLAIEGIQHLDDALDEGKGVVFLGSHLNSLGNFLTLMVLRQRGYAASIALPTPATLFPDTRLRLWLRGGSERASLMDEIGGFFAQFNVRPIVKRLAKNEIVAQTGDGLHSAAFLDAPFLGRMLPFTTGMLSVAQATGAIVVPFNVVGEAPRLRCSIGSPFHVDKGEDPQAHLNAAVARYVSQLENAVRTNTVSWEHWLIPQTLDTIASTPSVPLEERYHIEGRAGT